MNIFTINGLPGSGKDQFVKFCQNVIGEAKCLNISTVDYVKEIAKDLGWDGQKRPEDRKFLSDLKRILKEWKDIPYQKTMQDVMVWMSYTSELLKVPQDYLWVFIHTREPEEIQRFKDEYGADAILIRRPAVENNDQSNDSDANVMNYKYDCTVDNSGDLNDLYDIARNFVRTYELLNGNNPSIQSTK